MKKLSKSLKIVFLVFGVVIFTTGLTLGLVFGLKKNRNNDDPSVITNPYFTQEQLLLANALSANNSSQENYDLPNAGICEDDDIEKFGKNYFSYFDGNFEKLYVFEDSNVKELTVPSLSFIKEGAIKTRILQVKNYQAVIVSYFTETSPQNDHNRVYTLVDFEDIDNPIKIFEFDTTIISALVNFSLQDTYFVFTVIKDFEPFVPAGNLSVYAHKLTKTELTLDDCVIAEINDVDYSGSGVRFSVNSNSFVVSVGDRFNVCYFYNNQVKVYQKTIAENVDYVVNELFEDKFLLTQTVTAISSSEVFDYSLKDNNDEFVNYSYKILTVANGSIVESDYALVSGYNYVELISNQPYGYINLTLGKIANNEKVSGNYYKIYLDKNLTVVVEFNSTSATEELLCIDGKSFLTTHKILSAGKNTTPATKYVFGEEENYLRVNDDLLNYNKYFAIKKDSQFSLNIGLMDIDGNILINPENSDFVKLDKIVGDTCYLYDYNGVYYSFDTKTKTTVQEQASNVCNTINYNSQAEDRDSIDTDSDSGVSLYSGNYYECNFYDKLS